MYRYKVRKGDEMNWEIGIDIYTLLCVKLITNENVLHSMGGGLRSVCRIYIKLNLKMHSNIQ